MPCVLGPSVGGRSMKPLLQAMFDEIGRVSGVLLTGRIAKTEPEQPLRTVVIITPQSPQPLTHQCRLPESGKTPEHDNVIETEAPFLVHSSQLSLAAEDVAIVLGEQTGQVNVWHLGCHL